MTIKFTADKVKVNGPKVDGTYSITFDCGEYIWDAIKELPNLNGGIMNVEVKSDAR